MANTIFFCPISADFATAMGWAMRFNINTQKSIYLNSFSLDKFLSKSLISKVSDSLRPRNTSFIVRNFLLYNIQLLLYLACCLITLQPS